ncbi:aminotransferase [Brevundimonas sp. VNH65]|uniref:aminotransferase n=1 Tax=Brevundimonas sp. VNH65 TaxID=3400917 RepID=UPI003C008DC8
MNRDRLNPIYAQMGVTVFEAMSGAARDLGAINLGQGFPDAPGPRALLEAAARAVLDGPNQYPPSRGLPVLRDAVARHYGRHQGLDLTETGVLVTSGATEAIAAAVLTVVRPGDGVVVIEPAYDAYGPLVRRAGGEVQTVRLAPPDWRLTEAVIQAAVTPTTRALILNTPHNPTGRVFDDQEMAAVAAVCRRHDLIAISDEVWEHIVFDGRPFASLLSQPGMAERTIKVGSAGKMFGLTGWKIGFACGTPDLIEVVARAHQFLTFTTPPNLQSAVAEGLDWPDDWFADMRAGLQRSRDRLTSGLERAGFVVTPSEGTYFLCLDLPAAGLGQDDEALAWTLVREHGVASIPVSVFQSGPSTGVLRLCFAKSDEVLDQAIGRLARARDTLKA